VPTRIKQRAGRLQNPQFDSRIFNLPKIGGIHAAADTEEQCCHQRQGIEAGNAVIKVSTGMIMSGMGKPEPGTVRPLTTDERKIIGSECLPVGTMVRVDQDGHVTLAARNDRFPNRTRDQIASIQLSASNALALGYDTM
jgi:hypothetical protein